MAISLLQKEIMIRMTDPQLYVPVQHSSFPSEPSFKIDAAINQLYQMGYITAVQSENDEGSHWLAGLITPKGQAFLKEAGLV